MNVAHGVIASHPRSPPASSAASAMAQTQPAQPPTPPAQPPVFATTKVPGRRTVHLPLPGPSSDVRRDLPPASSRPIPSAISGPGGDTYIDEIKKVAKAPISISSIATITTITSPAENRSRTRARSWSSHQRAKEHLARLKNPDVWFPTSAWQQARHRSRRHAARAALCRAQHHSDNSLVCSFRRRRSSSGSTSSRSRRFIFRNMLDGFVPEWKTSLKRVLAMNWERYPRPSLCGGRLGDEQDVQNLIQYMSTSRRRAKARPTRAVLDTAVKEVKLPKYEKGAATRNTSPARRALLQLLGPRLLRSKIRRN